MLREMTILRNEELRIFTQEILRLKIMVKEEQSKVSAGLATVCHFHCHVDVTPADPSNSNQVAFLQARYLELAKSQAANEELASLQSRLDVGNKPIQSELALAPAQQVQATTFIATTRGSSSLSPPLNPSVTSPATDTDAPNPNIDRPHCVRADKPGYSSSHNEWHHQNFGWSFRIQDNPQVTLGDQWKKYVICIFTIPFSHGSVC